MRKEWLCSLHFGSLIAYGSAWYSRDPHSGTLTVDLRLVSFDPLQCKLERPAYQSTINVPVSGLEGLGDATQDKHLNRLKHRGVNLRLFNLSRSRLPGPKSDLRDGESVVSASSAFVPSCLCSG